MYRMPTECSCRLTFPISWILVIDFEYSGVWWVTHNTISTYKKCKGNIYKKKPCGRQGGWFCHIGWINTAMSQSLPVKLDAWHS